jgi:hypothetical protein
VKEYSSRTIPEEAPVATMVLASSILEVLFDSATELLVKVGMSKMNENSENGKP